MSELLFDLAYAYESGLGICNAIARFYDITY